MKQWLAKLNGKSSAPKAREFLYPTKKNVLAMFFVFQALPCCIFYFAEPANPITFWLKFEGVILGLICAWPLRPDHEMSAEDKAIELKWTNLMFSLGMGALLIPVLVMFLVENATPWMALNSFVIPVFLIVTVLCGVIRVQQGGFFSTQGTRADESDGETEEAASEEEAAPAPQAMPGPQKKK